MGKTIQEIVMRMQENLWKESIELVATNTDCNNWVFIKPDEFKTPYFVLIGYDGKPLPTGDSVEKIRMSAKWIEERKPIKEGGLFLDPDLVAEVSKIAKVFIDTVHEGKYPCVKLRETSVNNLEGKIIEALVMETTVDGFVFYAYLAGLTVEC